MSEMELDTMSETKQNIITIDGKEYDESTLSDESKYFIAQIRDIQNKQAKLRFEADQIQAALNAMSNALIQSVKPDDNADNS
jgi:hypothetical protein